jgi:hypothetical protein
MWFRPWAVAGGSVGQVSVGHQSTKLCRRGQRKGEPGQRSTYPLMSSCATAARAIITAVGFCICISLKRTFPSLVSFTSGQPYHQNAPSGLEIPLETFKCRGKERRLMGSSHLLHLLLASSLYPLVPSCFSSRRAVPWQRSRSCWPGHTKSKSVLRGVIATGRTARAVSTLVADHEQSGICSHTLRVGVEPLQRSHGCFLCDQIGLSHVYLCAPHPTGSRHPKAIVHLADLPPSMKLSRTTNSILE